MHMFPDPKEYNDALFPPEATIYGWRPDINDFRRTRFQTVKGALYVQLHIRLMNVLKECFLPSDLDLPGENILSFPRAR